MADVKLYMSSTCPYCASTMEYLDDKGVEYSKLDVQKNKDARKELMDMGHMGVPVLVIDGEEIVGFDKAKIDEHLDK